MDKSSFSSSVEYEAALRQRQYQGQEPVNPKIAGECLEDTVNAMGVNLSSTVGDCPLAAECSYSNDKISGVSGFCLKRAVGVSTE